MAEGVPILLQKDNTFTKLFVGGLPYHTTDETLRAFFLQHGDIEEAVVIYDRNTGKSKGYGFVTMANREGAENACENPNPVVDGRKANVNLAYLGAKPKNHSQPSSPLGLAAVAAATESPANISALFQQFSPPSALPLALQAQGFFLSSHPPPLGYYEGSPPFSPPPPMFSPFLYPPYFSPQYTSSGVGFIPPPQLNSPQQVPPIVPYNAAN